MLLTCEEIQSIKKANAQLIGDPKGVITARIFRCMRGDQVHLLFELLALQGMTPTSIQGVKVISTPDVVLIDRTEHPYENFDDEFQMMNAALCAVGKYSYINNVSVTAAAFVDKCKDKGASAEQVLVEIHKVFMDSDPRCSIKTFAPSMKVDGVKIVACLENNVGFRRCITEDFQYYEYWAEDDKMSATG